MPWKLDRQEDGLYKIWDSDQQRYTFTNLTRASLEEVFKRNNRNPKAVPKAVRNAEVMNRTERIKEPVQRPLRDPIVSIRASQLESLIDVIYELTPSSVDRLCYPWDELDSLKSMCDEERRA